MDTPDKGIPQDLLEKAECVAVFPSVIQAGLILGGRSGRGLSSCRTTVGWSAPAFFALGGDASVAAGPVGRQAGASTDLKHTAKILSYSQSKGLFAGLGLKRVVIKPDTGAMFTVQESRPQTY
jgi:SH3 domain-containing YSC84-like protein 1